MFATVALLDITHLLVRYLDMIKFTKKYCLEIYVAVCSL